jgi:SUN domain-containing protein 1/2
LKLTGLERILTHFKDDSSSRASEMETLHSEIVSLHHRLETVEASKEKLEAALNEFSNVKETLSKLESLVKECGDCKTSIVKVEGDNQDINLDNRIHSLIQNAIIYYAQDPVNKPDYALESSGGSILGTRCTKTYSGRPGVFSFFGIPVMKFYRSPRTVIQPSVHPGECWAFEKDHGQVVIQLSMEIFVSAVTLEHIPRSLSPFNRIDSAPKDFIIKVLESEKDHEGHLLGNFTYVDSGPSIQTFNTIPMDRSFRFILFEVLSNHGNPEYTCVYRLRVHGTPINP